MTADGVYITVVFEGVKNMSNKVEIVRGTTNTFQIAVYDADGRAYTLGVGEKIVFGIKEKATDTDLIFVKTASLLSAGNYLVTMDPADTEDLDCGKYVYDVALQSGEDFYNIIEANPFVIEPNVTSWGCAD